MPKSLASKKSSIAYGVGIRPILGVWVIFGLCFFVERKGMDFVAWKCDWNSPCQKVGSGRMVSNFGV